MEIPETRYATTADGVSIAYQILGDGPIDIVFANSAFVSNVEMVWELFPYVAGLVRGFASRGRVIWFDRRGTGLSDPVGGERLPTLEARMEDIRTVMDAAGAERPILASIEDAGAQCLLFAATYPERARALVTANPSVVGRWAPDAPWAWTEEQSAEDLQAIKEGWGTPQFVQAFAESVMPTFARDPEFVRAYGRMPDVLALLLRHALHVDVPEHPGGRLDRRQDVAHVGVPPHAFGGEGVGLAEGDADQRIPGAEFVRLERPEPDWAEFFTHFDRFVESLQKEEADFDRVLATVLFTDIVGATEKAAGLGDHAWRDVVEAHHSTVRALLGRYRGRQVDTAGDGFFSTFDGPARAIRCAAAIRDAVRPLGIEVRSGLHTGEVETINDKTGGIAVSIGARIVARAGPSEILVSQTVKDLVAGSGLVFEDAGEHELKGVPDRRRLYRVVG